MAAVFSVVLIAGGVAYLGYLQFTNPASVWYAGPPKPPPPPQIIFEEEATPAVPAETSAAAPAGEPVSDPVAAAPAAVPVPPAPSDSKAAPESSAPSPVEKWPTKVVSRTLVDKGPSKVVVQGSDSKRLRSLAVDDLVLPVFNAIPMNSGVKSLSPSGLSAVKLAVSSALSEKKLDQGPEGMKIEYSADLASVRRSLAARGFDVAKSWRLELNLVKNASFSSSADVLVAVQKAFSQKVPYAIDGEYRTAPEQIVKDMDRLKITVDDVPYVVSVTANSTGAGAVRLDIATAMP